MEQRRTFSAQKAKAEADFAFKTSEGTCKTNEGLFVLDDAHVLNSNSVHAASFSVRAENGQLQNGRTRLEENRAQQAKLERGEIDARIEARVREIEARIKESSDRRLATIEVLLPRLRP